MNDQHDPYAAQPYIPPSERTDQPVPQQPSPQQPYGSPEEPTAPIPAPGVPAPAADPVADPGPATGYEQPWSNPPQPVAQQPWIDPTTPTEPTAVLGDPAGGGVPPVGPPAPPVGGDGGGTSDGRRGGRVAAGAAALALVSALVGGAAGAVVVKANDNSSSSTSDSTGGSTLDKTSDSNLESTAVEQVAAKVLPSVVQITFASQSESGSGSGIIISADGDILTNNHVVEAVADGGQLNVAFNDGTSAPAKILGRDAATDIAVIKVDKTGLKPASLGDSSKLVVGQSVVAIGSPFGLESTVTTGIVSALNRPVSPGSESENSQVTTTFPAIQTDAAINPGNSGGPLVDLAGNVIGINSAIRSASDSSSSESGSIGLGFSIPINLARNVSTQILAGKTVEHPQIGVSVQTATENGGLTTNGARIAAVTAGSAGDKAGLKKDDVVTAVDGHPVASNEALIATIRGYKPGDKVTLTIQRGGQTKQIDVTLGSDGGNLSK